VQVRVHHSSQMVTSKITRKHHHVSTWNGTINTRKSLNCIPMYIYVHANLCYKHQVLLKTSTLLRLLFFFLNTRTVTRKFLQIFWKLNFPESTFLLLLDENKLSSFRAYWTARWTVDWHNQRWGVDSYPFTMTMRGSQGSPSRCTIHCTVPSTPISQRRPHRFVITLNANFLTCNIII